MCRSIKILRPPYAAGITGEDVHAAALQYVQTVSGFRQPPGHAAEAFSQAVAGVTALTRDLLAALDATTAGPAPPAPPGPPAQREGPGSPPAGQAPRAGQPRSRQERITAAPG